MQIDEGGNIFKDATGQPQTQRINRDDIPVTLKWLEKLLPGLDLQNNTLGSTGLKSSSGDIDLAVDSNRVTKEQLVQRLSDWVSSQDQDPRDWVRKSGISVHFKTPIGGNARKGYVQTDFMFVTKPEFSKFILRQDPESEYKGATRNVLINSIAKSMGYKLNQNTGIEDRATGRLISDDPDQIAKMLLNLKATSTELASVERIMAALKSDPQRDNKLADFRDHMQRSGTPLDENVDTEVNWMARLRDRIVKQGMIPLVEAEESGIGGRAKGIEHLEDLVFRNGTAGIQQALAIVQQAAAAPGETTTVKWDGKPAVVFGRKPDTGEFVLTDGSGFEAKGYDGLFTSPNAITQNMAQRDANAQAKGKTANRVKTLAPIYTRLWPQLEAAVPLDFRGYVKGDLLYMDTPPIIKGRYVFTPNTVTYRIPVNSALGKRIGTSDVGVAMHTMYADKNAPRQPLRGVDFKSVPGLLLIDPKTSVPTALSPNQQKISQLETIVRTRGANINALFNPAAMRDAKISDLARLCVDYVNTKVGQRLDPKTLLPEFGDWLRSNVTANKYNNIANYVNEPQRRDGMQAAFEAFLLLHDIKEDIRAQLDLQHPGQEGWVMATPAGYSKAVGRFDPEGFAALNRAHNNPQPQ